MRNIDTIIVHCAATYPSMDIGVKEIRLWHTRDNGWNDIGYHHVIRRDGTVEQGRPEETAGAHCQNHNARSIGVCLVGGLEKAPSGKSIPSANYTEAQYQALRSLIATLLKRYPGATVCGHQDFANKACPCFDVAAWWAHKKEQSHA